MIRPVRHVLQLGHAALLLLAACRSAPATIADDEPVRPFKAPGFAMQLPLAAQAEERPGAGYTVWYIHDGDEFLGGIYVGCAADFPAPVPIPGVEQLLTDDDLSLRVSYRKDGVLVQRQWLLLRPRLGTKFKDGIPEPPPWPCHVHVWTAGSPTGVSLRSLHTMASVVAAWDEPTGRTTR